jgi:hypothetical protein
MAFFLTSLSKPATEVTYLNTVYIDKAKFALAFFKDHEMDIKIPLTSLRKKMRGWA